MSIETICKKKVIRSSFVDILMNFFFLLEVFIIYLITKNKINI